MGKVTEDEMRCNCCGLYNVNEGFLKKVNEAREISKTAYVITSGCRCTKHNTAVGGHPKSMHLATELKECEACDIAANTDRKRFDILSGLIKAGFTHIGIAKTFIHVDNSPKKAIWLY